MNGSIKSEVILMKRKKKQWNNCEDFLNLSNGSNKNKKKKKKKNEKKQKNKKMKKNNVTK